MSIKVSIIIPVFNSSKYLHEMINSLINQSLKEIQFIFVDDCSTDNSIEILTSYEKKDPDRILIVKNEKNQGPGAARNIGLKFAEGEYIGFVDSDDYVDLNMYKVMYEKAKSNNYDIVECGYFNERKNKNMQMWNSDFEGNITSEKRIKMFMSCGFIVTKIFKRSILINNNIEFIPNIPLEDVYFLSKVYCKINSVGIVEENFYYYRNNKDSFSYKKNGKTLFEVNNIFSKYYIEGMSVEEIYKYYKPVFDYVVIDIWFDTFKNYVENNKNIKTNDLEIIDNQIKQYIKDYNQNIFFVEKAKVDNLAKAFLINAVNHTEVINILKNNE